MCLLSAIYYFINFLYDISNFLTNYNNFQLYWSNSIDVGKFHNIQLPIVFYISSRVSKSIKCSSLAFSKICINLATVRAALLHWCSAMFLTFQVISIGERSIGRQHSH